MNPIEKKQKEHHEIFFHDVLNRGPDAYDGFINPESIWYWMHIRCLEHIKDFFKGIKTSSFLTVGDGYCGREAGYIKRFGHWVHASDWEPCLLEMAKSKGLVDDCSKQDVNELEFDDEAFDYVLTKETLHHLTTPYRGLCEMLRVAKKGIILIEPNGDNGQKYNCETFEPTGNFLFMFSSNELMKIGAAYGYKFFAFTYSMVFYGFHDQKAIQSGRVEEEKKRLLAVEEQMVFDYRPLLVFFFLRSKEDSNLLTDPKFIRKEIKNG